MITVAGGVKALYRRTLPNASCSCVTRPDSVSDTARDQQPDVWLWHPRRSYSVGVKLSYWQNACSNRGMAISTSVFGRLETFPQ